MEKLWGTTAKRPTNYYYPRKNVKNGPTINFTTSGPAGFELIKCFAHPEI